MKEENWKQQRGTRSLSSAYPVLDEESGNIAPSVVAAATSEVRAGLLPPVTPPCNGVAVGGQNRSDDLSNLLRTVTSSSLSPMSSRGASLYPTLGAINSVPQEITWDSTFASPSTEGGGPCSKALGSTVVTKPVVESAPFVPSASKREFRLSDLPSVPVGGQHGPHTRAPHSSYAASKASAVPATKPNGGPLFGTRPSTRNSLDDDLPENARKLQEQHSVFLSAKSMNAAEEILSPTTSLSAKADAAVAASLFQTSTPAAASSTTTSFSPSETTSANLAASTPSSILKPAPPTRSLSKPQVSFAALPRVRDSNVASQDFVDAMDTKLPASIATNHNREDSLSQSSTANLSPMDVEEARGYAQSLMILCEDTSSVDLESLENLCAMCTSVLESVNRAIEEALNFGDEGSLQDLFQLNDILTHAIKVGDRARDLLPRTASSSGKAPEEVPPSAITKVERLSPSYLRSTVSSSSHSDADHLTEDETMDNSTTNLNVPVLVEKQDIFSLICMLRAQHTERRLEAAYALMVFARDESLHLRHEIRSSGGMHSLLTLFRTPGTPYETKVVLALAVTSLLEEVEKIPARLGLKVVDCLRLLSHARKITPNGHVISEEECVRASAKGVLLFWMNQLLPMLESEKGGRETQKSVNEGNIPLDRTSSGIPRLRSSRVATAGGGLFDHRRESIEIQELLEMTVSLIVYMAEPNNDRPTQYEAFTLVEEVCAVEVARPIAVREGILRTLVSWISSQEPVKIRPAASALRHLTSIKDSYMAGWIHSQMVTEGALEVIVSLMHDDLDQGVGHDVQLAVAHILSSLCVAPHTRAAVADANGIALLIQFVVDYKSSPSQEGALLAGSALLQLASGAITRASVFGNETFDAETDFVSNYKRDDVVEIIIDNGAIESFVEIAQSDKGKLRSMAVEALRVLSEDVSSSRQTRGKLCEHGAAKALGVALKENVESNGEIMSSDMSLFTDGNALKELHEALCALANILDPLPEGAPIGYHQRQISDGLDTRKLLINGCIQTTDSGGLEALLFIASIPFLPADSSNLDDSHFRMMGLLEEACRSLASMSPLLLTESVASCGYSKWTDDVLKALYKVTKQLQNAARVVESIRESVTEVEVSILRGLGALARSEPLKIRIIDRFLPFLLAMNAVRDGTNTSNAANQAFQSLGFTDDEVAVQVAGNNPQLLADWFCLERSCLIQAMARDEIRDLVQDIWIVPFKETCNNLSITRLIRETSDISRSEDSGSLCADLFENFANDSDTCKKRESMLRQYRAIYGIGAKPSPLFETVSGELGDNDHSECLLSRQIYPLNSSEDETEWILAHERVVQKDELPSSDMPNQRLSPHVENLLDRVFPSHLIRNQVLPIYSLCPRASFNFRGLMMPERRYFSFRREGQLLSRLCATEAAALDSADVHWTLGFTNSFFAGEFSESLVQALYMCPMVLGLSFSNVTGVGERLPDKESKDDEGGAILANLVGALPPWISSLTFDGLLSDRDMNSLVAILETMSKLSAGHDTQLDRPMTLTRDKDGSSCSAQGQGRFCFFSIRRSCQIHRDSWNSFFRLLGASGTSSHRFSKPLSTLKVLDLSGNQLGDELCAAVLRLAHDSDSGCLLEQLDLSGNRILAGASVLKVLRGYVYRYAHQTGRKGWKSPLHTLILANNGLCVGNGGKAWIEFISLLEHNALELHVLDLSENGLVLGDHEVEYCDVIISALLKNSSLQRLNLSSNTFSHGAVNHILDGLVAATHDSVLAFLQLNKNSPPLAGQQHGVLASFCSRSRKILLQRFMVEREKSLEDDLLADSEAFSPAATKQSSSPQEFSIQDDEPSSLLDTPLDDGPDVLSLPDTTSGDSTITVLFSAPLVFYDERKVLQPFAKLDFRLERELMWQSLKEASRDIQLFFDTATPDRFLAAISKRCSCLHYSGHGHQEYLPFEDRGAPNWLGTNDIRNLIATEDGASFRFVFVSACHSYNVGQTFATAGVSHVVCCEEESELKDNAALAFTRNFYLALAVGNTVKESFDQGCKAVRATPNLRNPEKEMKKFRLLPEDGDHNVPIFVNAKPVLEWPRSLSEKVVSARHLRKSTRHLRKSFYSGETSTMELSVRNMIQEDPSPSPSQFFLGREVDMYKVLRQVLENRLVSVVGEAGVGRSSLVCAVCHYINERASTMHEIERIYFVKAEKGGRKKQSLALIRRLIQRLREAEKLPDLPGLDADIETDIETMTEVASKALRNDKALIVFDRVDLLDDADEASEFHIALKNLLSETRNLKVVLTNRRPLGIPSIGEKSVELLPLNLGHTVRLFAFLCPYVHTPKERQKLFKAAVAVAQESLLPTDPGLSPSTIELFSVLGSGIPSRIEKAAYNCSKDLYISLMTGSFLDSLVEGQGT